MPRLGLDFRRFIKLMFPSLTDDQDIFNTFQPNKPPTIIASHVVWINHGDSISENIKYSWEIDKMILDIAVHKAAEMSTNPNSSTLVSKPTQETVDYKESYVKISLFWIPYRI